MNLFHIAWRNLQHRWLASWLTLLSMALGVALVVLVLAISGLIQETFRRNSNVGYNLVVGPKGSPLQLTLSSVFYLSKPVGTLPYRYYLEYLPKPAREQAYRQLGGSPEEGARNGSYGMFVGNGFALPICLGDYVGPFRIVATTVDYLGQLRHGPDNDRTFGFAEGRNFEEDSQEHGFFEAVVGSIVAKEMNFKLGDVIYPSHGPDGEAHGDGFTIVGILEPTGTPTDRVALINIEGFYLLEGHVAPERDEETGLEKAAKPAGEQQESQVERQVDSTATSKAGRKRLPLDQREVSAILLKTAGFVGIGLQQQINKSSRAQAVSPIGEIAGLLETFFQPAQWALLALTVLVCLVSAISILVSIYNSMHERTRDIAVMRALGAGRNTVLLVILAEALLISVGGGLLGWTIGHAIAAAASPVVEARTGIRVGFWSMNSVAEPFIIPGLVVIGILAGLLPALMAYRTDVSRSLAS
jgi:putative ABC transport system permease protein